MSGNSSSSFSDSFVDPGCLFSGPSSVIFNSFVITNILLLLPLCIFILHLGLQQWRQKRSTSSAATVSHCDCFTYHMVAIELVGVFACIVFICGVETGDYMTAYVGGLVMYINWFGQTFFHVLTCVERYLAVVHPITYLSLRNQRAIRIRNIIIGCVWLLSYAGMSLTTVQSFFVFIYLVIMSSSLIIISFCSLSVLRVLIRPGPGEQGGGRERVDQSKQKVFYTIMAILGVLVLRFACCLVWAVVSVSGGNDCVIRACQVWFSLPSSLVLPLLFLHRAGKLMCCKKNIQ